MPTKTFTKEIASPLCFIDHAAKSWMRLLLREDNFCNEYRLEMPSVHWKSRSHDPSTLPESIVLSKNPFL